MDSNLSVINDRPLGSNSGGRQDGYHSNSGRCDIDRDSNGDHSCDCRSRVCARTCYSRRARSDCRCRAYNRCDWRWRLLAVQAVSQDKLGSHRPRTQFAVRFAAGGFFVLPSPSIRQGRPTTVVTLGASNAFSFLLPPFGSKRSKGTGPADLRLVSLRVRTFLEMSYLHREGLSALRVFFGLAKCNCGPVNTMTTFGDKGVAGKKSAFIRAEKSHTVSTSRQVCEHHAEDYTPAATQTDDTVS